MCPILISYLSNINFNIQALIKLEEPRQNLEVIQKEIEAMGGFIKGLLPQSNKDTGPAPHTDDDMEFLENTKAPPSGMSSRQSPFINNPMLLMDESAINVERLLRTCDQGVQANIPTNFCHICQKKRTQYATLTARKVLTKEISRVELQNMDIAQVYNNQSEIKPKVREKAHRHNSLNISPQRQINIAKIFDNINNSKSLDEKEKVSIAKLSSFFSNSTFLQQTLINEIYPIGTEPHPFQDNSEDENDSNNGEHKMAPKQKFGLSKIIPDNSLNDTSFSHQLLNDISY